MRHESQFDCLGTVNVAELGVSCADYRHRETGARHFHIASPENHHVFMVAFRTPAEDDSGVTHVLEHMVLCGSRRYPLRDAFFAMQSRSINTGMNAFTTPDASAYHFSTRNSVDYRNLLAVYLDGVFFPLLDAETFYREGVRIEHDAETGAVAHNGVVYNEMQGAAGDAALCMRQALRAGLFPGSRYSFNDGGVPAALGQLSRSRVREYHERCYHPSNAVFLTYGNISAQQHQLWLREFALDELASGAVSRPVLDVPSPPSSIERLEIACPGSGRSGPAYCALGWRIPGDGPESIAGLRYLAELLTDAKEGWLPPILHQAGFDNRWDAVTGLDDSMIDPVFAVAERIDSPDRSGDFFRSVIETIKNVGRQAPLQLAESVRDRCELRLRDPVHSREPPGLVLLKRALSAWLFDRDPLRALQLRPALAELADADPAEIIRRIEENLLENKYRVEVVLQPEGDLGTRWARARSAGADKHPTAPGAFPGQSYDGGGILPVLSAGEIESDERPPLKATQRCSGGVPVTAYRGAVSGVAHIRASIDLGGLAPDMLDLAGLVPYWLALPRTSAGQRCLSPAILVRNDHWYPLLQVELRILSSRLEGLIERAPLFMDPPRSVDNCDVLAMARSHCAAALAHRGHEYAILAAAAGLNARGALLHRWAGIGVFAQAAPGSVQDCSADALHLVLTRMWAALGEAPFALMVSHHRPVLVPGDCFGQRAPPFQIGRCIDDAGSDSTAVVWCADTPVNYCASVLGCARPGNAREAAALELAAAAIENLYLKPAIRHQGGAYGVGARYEPELSALCLFSFRDPRTLGTFRDMEAAWMALADDPLAPNRLHEARLSALGRVERRTLSPGTPATSDHDDWLRGRSVEYRRDWREALLSIDSVELVTAIRELVRAQDPYRAAVTDRKSLGPLQRAGFQLAGRVGCA